MTFTRRHPVRLNSSGKALNAICTLSFSLVTLVYQPGLLFFFATLWLLWVISLVEGRRAQAQLSSLKTEWVTGAAELSLTRGQHHKVTLRLTNPQRFDIVNLRLQLRGQEGLSDPLFLDITAGEQLNLPVTLEARSIGEEQLWGVELAWAGPLRTHELFIQRSLPLRYRVTPNLAQGQLLYLKSERAPGDGRGRRARTQEGEFQELRAYQKGDELKRVAWRASARRGTLLSKVYEESRQRRLLIALDVGPAMRTFSESQERAITHAIELANAELHRSRELEVGLTLFDHRLIGALAPSAKPSAHYAQLLQYAAQVYESDCIELTQQHLIATLGEYLYYTGVDAARLGGFDHVRSGAKELLLANEYWAEAIDEHTSQAILSTHAYPRGLSSHDWRTRHLSACLMLGVRVPYRQSSQYGSTANVMRALCAQARQWGVTELMVLSNADRVELQSDLFPLRAWMKEGGRLTWCDFSERRPDAPSLPQLPSLYSSEELLMSLTPSAKLIKVSAPFTSYLTPLNMPAARFGVDLKRP